MRRSSRKPVQEPRVRCAIYTRKSTEDGLEQEFNTLDAQRESCEAYIKSQQHEGWECIPEQYNDGGFSGGNMERPAFQRLLQDIEDDKVDCIVVYKVDRLSRSLLDFARIMERLERKNVSFVSITQQFSTANSMGRLTLNVLLSFAQFEREVISERTRDKIAAARRKGKWVGGRPMLGYDIRPGRGGLVINELEARQVREIFQIYTQTQSLLQTAKEMKSRGWTCKRWINKNGKESGGTPFTKGNLFNHLTNVIYCGKITYKDEVHEGEHEAIIDHATWQKVQSLLKRNGGSKNHGRNKYGALLRGLLECKPCQAPMYHTYTVKNGNAQYRYYACANGHKNGWDQCPGKALPAGEIEKFVLDRIRNIAGDQRLLDEVVRLAHEKNAAQIAELDKEHSGLRRELGRYTRQMEEILKSLSNPGGIEGVHTVHLADMQERIANVEIRMTEVNRRISQIESQSISSQDLKIAMQHFDPVWDELSLAEQSRLMSLLVSRISYDAEGGEMIIDFHPSGIKGLVKESF